jgi:hypothetical protein
MTIPAPNGVPRIGTLATIIIAVLAVMEPPIALLIVSGLIYANA